MRFYTLDGCFYEGMNQETIIQLRTELGLETIFTTREEYETVVKSHEWQPGN